MSYFGVVTHGVVVLENGQHIPEGMRVEVTVPDETPTLWTTMQHHVGTLPDSPADLAEQHDHYIHGTPKR